MAISIVDKLSWKMPISVQNEAISQILSADDFDWNSLILPYGKKDSWQNCAVVLARLSNDTIKLLVNNLMAWFQDANWPGTEIIADRLRSLPPEVLSNAVLPAKRRATETNDSDWSDHLEYYFGSKGKIGFGLVM